MPQCEDRTKCHIVKTTQNATECVTFMKQRRNKDVSGVSRECNKGVTVTYIGELEAKTAT